MRINPVLLLVLLVFLTGFGFGVGLLTGSNSAKENYNTRCMKYFGSKGYPADGYCKLFIGAIKARDEQ